MGWGDAWAGLSQQAFGATVDILQQKEQRKYQTERDEMARRAAEQQEKARRDWEEKMSKQKMEFEKGLRTEDRNYRMKENKQQQSFQLSRDAAQATREANDPYRKALVEESRARVEAMRSPATGGGSGARGGGLAQPKAPDSVLSQANDDFVEEVKRLVEEGRTPEQAQGEAFAKLQSIYDRDILSRIRPGLSNMQGQVSRAAGALGRTAGDVMQYFIP